jgi:hypothetical protein
MFANSTRVLLTFREDVLGRARVFPALKLAEHEVRLTETSRSTRLRHRRPLTSGAPECGRVGVVVGLALP